VPAVNDTAGFLKGDYSDGRRLVTFRDLDDVKANENMLKGVIQVWLSLINK
jgi:hypothetical protein